MYWSNYRKQGPTSKHFPNQMIWKGFSIWRELKKSSQKACVSNFQYLDSRLATHPTVCVRLMDYWFVRVFGSLKNEEMVAQREVLSYQGHLVATCPAL